MKKILCLVSLAVLFASCGREAISIKGPAYSGNIQKEYLNRGLVAISNGDGKVSVAWRYLESDPVDVAFDLYRNEVKLNSAPLTGSTFFTDTAADTSVDNVYTVKVAGSSAIEDGAGYTLTAAKAAKPYLEIPIKPVEGFAEGYYTPNDASVADLDGDGEYEIVVKLETRTYDNSRGGICDEGLLIDAYKLDGTFMWRVDLGLNIRQGAHYTQMMLYDFDGDGKAELAVKTSEGTKFGDGTVIGDTDGDGRTDYREMDQSKRTYGMILEGPEFLSIIEGTTGKELARTDFIPRGSTYEFGDAEGNRVDRYLGGAGYFDGKRPSILICRGYYAKSVVEAWDWRNGKLTKRWSFNTMDNNNEYAKYEGQGAHNIRIGDVDGDGKDEVVYGACMIDDNGKGVYTTQIGHGDAMHLLDINVDRPGLEVWMCHEDSPNRAGSEMRDAATGELLWSFPSISDVGRAMCSDIDPRFRGAEAWSSNTNGTYTAEGRFITSVKPSVNFAIWWDGDLNRELLDSGSGAQSMDPELIASLRAQMQRQTAQSRPQGMRPQGQPGQPQGMRPQGPQQPLSPEMQKMNARFMRISKWNGDGVDYFDLPGQEETGINNGSKSNPVISADLFGDWREELVVRTNDNKSLRVYMTDIPTEYRFHTLMSDIVYRLSVLCENICYNQPPHVGYPLGSDLGKMWPTRLVADMSVNGSLHTKGAAGMNARMDGIIEQKEENIVIYKNIADSYTLDAYLDYDSYEWTVNGKVLGHDRTLVLHQSEYGYDKPIKVSVKTTMKGQVFEDGGTVTFSSEEGRLGYWSDRDRERKGVWGF